MCMTAEIFILINLKYSAITDTRVRKHNQKENVAMKTQKLQITLTIVDNHSQTQQ